MADYFFGCRSQLCSVDFEGNTMSDIAAWTITFIAYAFSLIALVIVLSFIWWHDQ
jgi:hypothetical protein